MTSHSLYKTSHLAGAVHNTLGNYRDWQERCQENSNILVGEKTCDADNIFYGCSRLDCFGEDPVTQKPLPRKEIAAWQTAIQNCKSSQKEFKLQAPILESIWEMGQAGIVDCRDGLQRLSEGKEISQSHEPIMYSTLTRYLPSAALQAEHAVRISQEDRRPEWRKNFERFFHPVGFFIETGEDRRLHAGDQVELEEAMDRLQTLCSMNDGDYDHGALQSKLAKFRSHIQQNLMQLESAHKELTQKIRAAEEYHDQASRKIARQHQQERHQHNRQHFRESLMREISA